MIARIVVTGGRRFTDLTRIEADLRSLLPFGLQSVAQGGNGIPQTDGLETWKPTRSADALAWCCARQLGLHTPTYFMDRETHHEHAGPRRNIEMIEAEKPDLVLAYPHPASSGTWHCVRTAIERGITVAIWHPGDGSRFGTPTMRSHTAWSTLGWALDRCGLRSWLQQRDRGFLIPEIGVAGDRWQVVSEALAAAARAA